MRRVLPADNSPYDNKPPMKIRELILSPSAERDIDAVYHYITDTVKMPAVAVAYRNGIYDTIRQLSRTGGMLQINPRPSLRRLYGPSVRTTVYKKMTIIYTVTDDTVLVHRIIAGSLLI